MLRYIYAIARSRRDIHFDLNASVDKKMMEHIVKIIQFPTADARDHWISEVHAFCNRVAKLKGSNKYPSAKFIYGILSSNNDIIHAYVQYAIDSEPDGIFANVPEGRCIEIADRYQYWLSAMLSKYGSVTLEDVSTELNKLTAAQGVC